MDQGRPPPLPSAYRRVDPVDEHLLLAAARPLREACEALHLALLCLEGQDSEDSPAARHRVAAQARSFLAEAVTALNRARVYVPAVFSYTVPVVAASDPDPAVELGRLHQIATRLLWRNHSFLPSRREAPLLPEDEAQLAVLVRALARTTRAAKALRHAWVAAALAIAITLPLLGPAAVAVALSGFLALVCALQAIAALTRAPALPERV